VVGPARLLGEGGKEMPVFGRLARLSDATVNVRLLLWQTGLNAVHAAAPADLMDGKRDSFHFLRDAIGYGPECIGVAANLHAVPGLVRYHAGETIDRMHNDVFDNLLSIGLAGAIASLMLVAAAFFYSLRYLGYISDGRRRNLFLIFVALGSAAGIIVPWVLGSPQLAGIGVQAGLLTGLFVFVAWCGFGNPASALDGQKLLVLCILAALIAHFVETGVGIAVTPTRLYFFLLLAVLTVLATGNLKQEESPRPQTLDRPWFRNPLLPFAAITSLLIFAVSWCFISNAEEERSTLLLFLRTWFAPPPEARFFLPGAILLFLMTVVGSLALMAGEFLEQRAPKAHFWKTAKPWIIFMVFLWLAAGLISAAFSTALDLMAALPVNVSFHAEARMAFFVVGLLLLLIAAGLSLMAAEAPGYAAADPVRIWALWPCLLLSICAYAAIGELTVRPARADIARRIAGICETSVSAAAAIPVYERAAELAPRVASYQISLGFARRHVGMSERDPSRSEVLLGAAEQSYRRALVLNPFDPTGYRALGSLYTQIGERMSDKTARDARLRKALPFFRQAAQLAPNSWNTYTELGRCHFLLGEHKQARELYEKSLGMNPRSARTYMFLGELQYWQKDLEQALRSFWRASWLDRKNLEARKNTGFLLALLGRKEEAIRVDLEALAQSPKDLTLLRRLASLYFSLADFKNGMTYARRAYEITPPSGKRSLDAFVQELQTEAR
jgi:tetratricopeptide (TPR) repeat protein